MIDAKELHNLLIVDYSSGRLFWRERTPDMFCSNVNTKEQNCKIWNTRYSGKEAFLCEDGHGYKISAIFNKKYSAHRVIWAMANGRWPRLIDHINQDKSDNRLCNLREADKSLNSLNSKLRSDNTSGYKGVTRHQGKWLSQAKGKYIGMFDCPKEAHLAYLSAISK